MINSVNAKLSLRTWRGGGTRPQQCHLGDTVRLQRLVGEEMECVLIAPWPSWYPLCRLRLRLIHQERCCTCKERLQIAYVHESVQRGPSKIPELLNPPTVFNKNHRVALDGDKPLTECEEESLVEEEARAGGHDESGDTCNLLYQARQAPEAQKFRLFPTAHNEEKHFQRTGSQRRSKCLNPLSLRRWMKNGGLRH